jgi:hypothetical protein
MSKKRATRPWVVDEEQRKGPQGRPRSGPRNFAVRQLPRATIRASGRTLALWEAILADQGVQAHTAFEKVLSVYLETLSPESRTAVERRSKAIRRERFRDTP